MAKIIEEQVFGSELFVPALYDHFSIDLTGMPNGDPCLVVNAAAASNPDVRAFCPAPTLTPNIFKVGGEGPFTISWWHKSTSVLGAGNFYFGVQNASAGSAVNNTHPLRISIQADNNLGLGSTNVQIANGLGANTSYTLGGFTLGNTWVFNVVGFNAPGSAGFTFRVEAPSSPPGSLTATAARATGTASFGASQFFYIGKYGDDSPTPTTGTRVIRLGKIAFHDRLLTLAECQAMYNTMMA